MLGQIFFAGDCKLVDLGTDLESEGQQMPVGRVLQLGVNFDMGFPGYDLRGEKMNFKQLY